MHLARAGFRIAVHYNSNRTAAEDTLHALNGTGHSVIAADLSQAEAASELADAALRDHDGRIDVLVHNAGLYLETPFLKSRSPASWSSTVQKMMQLNFFAGADLAYRLVPSMAAVGWGRIIQIASRSGLRGEPEFAGYAASKAAQINFNKSLAAELAPHGIGCFAIAPGWVETDMAAHALAERGESIRAEIPVGRVASREDIAELVTWLVTPAADYLTGNTINVNGASYLG